MKLHEHLTRLRYRLKGWIRDPFGRGNAYLIQRFVDKHRNQIVLDCGDDIAILLGWIVGDDDYYYVEWAYRERCIRLVTCVGYCIPIERRVSWDERRALQSVRLNCPPVEEMLLEFQKLNCGKLL